MTSGIFFWGLAYICDSSKKWEEKSMKKFLSYFKGEKVKTFIALCLLSIGLNILGPYLNSKIVGALNKGEFDRMLFLAMMFAIVSIFISLTRFGINRISAGIKNRVEKKMDLELFNKILNMKGRFIEEYKSGELTSISKKNPAELLDNFADVVNSFFGIISAIAVALYVAYMNLWFFMLYVIFFLVIYVNQINSLKKEKKNIEKKKHQDDTAISLVNQVYKAIMDIKIFNLKKIMLTKYEILIDSEMKAKKDQIKAKENNRLFGGIAFQIYTLFFFILGITLLIQGNLTVENFIAIYMYRGYMYSLMYDVAEVRSKWVEMKTLIERIDRILSIDSKKMEQFGDCINEDDSNKEAISFSDVSFSYGKADELKNISFEIKTGEMIGIVGESGSFKTTLIKLLTRQLESKAGEIKINGININEYSEDAYSKMVSLASQQPVAFATSIRENLLMAKPEASEKEIWQALQKARIMDWVKSLPDKLDTIINESLNLSGGQLQRVALARVFLKDTPIVIFDEATSAIDNQNQAQITKLIKEQAKNKIIIVIAHRVDAIRCSDRIIFMEHGRIAGIGSHKELLEKNSRYKKIIAQE